MDILGRYYTVEAFSHLLIDRLSTKNPMNVIELGVGKGSLLKAAINKWMLSSFYATDIDNNSIREIKKKFPFVNTFQLDTIKEDLLKKIKINEENFDIAICNPPYTRIKTSYNFSELFTQSNLNECCNLKSVTSDIVFLAKNLQLLKNGGELGIILPDSLITGKDFLNLRNSILKRHNIKGIIQLPERVFPKTEALTHILILEKNRTSKEKIPIFLSDYNGQLIDKIQVDQDALVQRMDFKYHSWNKKDNKKDTTKTLGSLRAEIKRGSLTHNELKKFDQFIHTTSIKHLNEKQSFKNTIYRNERFVTSRSGDILLSRVGRNIKLCKVYRGQSLISDCVYRIRVSPKYRTKVWKALTSIEGQQMLKALNHGVCAKVLSKKDLLDFPIC